METPLHRLRRHRRICRYPTSGDAACLERCRLPLPRLRGSCPEGTEGVSAQRSVAPCHESSATRIAWWNGCLRSPQEKAPASLWKGPLGSRYFFFGLGGGGTKPSTDIAIASLLRFAGTPRIKDASSTPVEGSLVAPKITAFAPTLAARSCIDL